MYRRSELSGAEATKVSERHAGRSLRMERKKLNELILGRFRHHLRPAIISPILEQDDFT